MKSQELLENMDPLSLADFFSCSFSIPKVTDLSLFKKMGEVPDLSLFFGNDPISKLSLGWNESGIAGKVVVQKTLEKSSFPDFAKGDSLEIFIDTRDHKKSGFATRFCHHFVFLPEEVNGISAQEMTRFRSEDKHTLCDPKDLELRVEVEKKEYTLFFLIRESALHGFSPESFSRIGFSYKVNLYKAEAESFPVSSLYFDLSQHPSLWASVTLT